MKSSLLNVLACSLLSCSLAGLAWGDGYCHLSRWSPATLSEGSKYGREVALSGNLAAISAVGEVYVYERQGAEWVEIDRIEDPNPGLTLFGYSLALAGDQLVVGAYHDSTLAAAGGSVHVYERGDSGYALVQSLSSPAPQALGYFGLSLALTENWLAVGAPSTGPGGATFVFTRVAQGWELFGEFQEPLSSYYGVSVAMHEMGPLDVELFVGDSNSHSPAQNAGQVHHYTLDEGVIDPHAPVWPSGAFGQGHFGYDLAYDGEHLVVGAFGDNEADSYAGAAYVFDAPAGTGTVTLNQKLFPSGFAEYADFGTDVALHGDRVVVGCTGQGVPAGSGSVYVFQPDDFGFNWVIEDVLEPADAAHLGYFGGAVAANDTGVVVGSALYDAPGTDFGGAYYVSLSPKGDLSGECPCDVLAVAETLGEGKPGAAGVPLLESPSLPVPGTTHVLRLSDVFVGAAPLLFWGTAPGAHPFDEGTLYVHPTHMTALPTVGVLGQTGIGWTVPTSPALCGVELFAQALLLDPGASGPLHTALSNGLHMTIGY